MSGNLQIAIAVIFFIALSALSIMGAILYAENREISQTNQKLAELKDSRGVKHLNLEDPEVKKILDEEGGKGIRETHSALKLSFVFVGICALFLALFIVRVRRKQACAP
jgi:hypothetical protein